MISRYGDAIEADLRQYYGVDLLDVWRSRLTPRQVLVLIDQLPRHSRYLAAVADDDEVADQLADEPDGPPPPPPLTEWSAEVERLTLIADRLGELITLFAAVNSKKKPPPYRNLPRPVTARQRAERRRRERKRDLIAERLAAARAAGRPTMADVQADPAMQARVRRGRVVWPTGTTP
ncbi:hypothetical protein [uncultured Thermomonospora sp.]|uniref:hypothetical protein n=1 Tax=uncultured Thermomonospora sp. TaxID=671175 RepID=UPI00259BE276|nr:hypothetical protein [uncultured Thermomonospora sp.]